MVTHPAYQSDEAGAEKIEQEQAQMGLAKPPVQYVDGAYVSGKKLVDAQAELHPVEDAFHDEFGVTTNGVLERRITLAFPMPNNRAGWIDAIVDSGINVDSSGYAGYVHMAAGWTDSRSPELPPIEDQYVDEGTLWRMSIEPIAHGIPVDFWLFTVPQVDPGGTPTNFNYTLGGAMTGFLEWTPTELQGPSTNMVTVSVYQNACTWLGATRSFRIIVREVNSPPQRLW